MKLYKSSTYDRLAEQLAHNIKNTTNTIFQPEVIVGANNMTEQYIKSFIAEKNGIATNLQFYNWRELTHQLFHILRPTTFEAEYLHPNKAIMYLFDALQSLDSLQFEEVTNYFKGNISKRYGLAKKIYGLFSNYIKYNPSIIHTWEQHNFNFANNPHEKWQYELWHLFRNQVKAANQYDAYEIYCIINNSLDIANQQNAIAAAIKAKLPTIHFFKLENCTVSELEIIEKLSHFSKVWLYHSSTDTSSDPFHISNLWKGNTNIIDKKLSNFSKVTLANSFNSEGNSTLLQVQNKIKGYQQTINSIDNSIIIDGHFTAFREIEGLFNRLIEAFVANPNLKSREIVVYCNDLKAYIPAIHNFFSHPKYKMPYRIFGEYAYEQHSNLMTLHRILKFIKSDLFKSDLIKIIKFPGISTKFGFKDFDLVEHWINTSNILHGYSGDEEKGLHLISWEQGLRRMMYGSCIGMEAESDETFKDECFIDVAEGTNMNQLVALEYLMRNVNQFQQEAQHSRTITQWIEFTERIIETFLPTDIDFQIEQFKMELFQLNIDTYEHLTYNDWLYFIEHFFEQPASLVKPQNNGITFTELKNAHVIPASISAVLGLRYDNFTLNPTELSFDLLKSNEEYECSKAKEKDKYNFLQIVLQTKDKLLFSIQSHNPKDNKSLPCNLILEQLMDFCGNSLQIIEHPLHGFNPKYNQEHNPKLVSYTQLSHNNASLILKPKEVKENTIINEEVIIPLNDFCKFFNDSFKYFYNKQLNVYYNEDEIQNNDYEPIECSGLDSWKINTFLKENKKTANELLNNESLLKSFLQKNKFPLRELSKYYIRKAYSKYQTVHEQYHDIIKDKTAENFKFTHTTVIDNITYKIVSDDIELFDNTLIWPVFSSNIEKHALQFNIQCMLLAINNEKFNEGYLLEGNNQHTIIFTKEARQGLVSSINKLIKQFTAKDLNPFYIDKTYFDLIKKSKKLVKELNVDLNEFSKYLNLTILKDRTLLVNLIENNSFIIDNKLNDNLWSKIIQH